MVDLEGRLCPEDIAPEDRTPREQMLDVGLSYYDALTGEDGTLAPFALECERRENGSTSVGGKKETSESTQMEISLHRIQ